MDPDLAKHRSEVIRRLAELKRQDSKRTAKGVLGTTPRFIEVLVPVKG